MVQCDQAQQLDDRSALGKNLSDCRAMLQSLLSSMSEGLILINAEGRIGYWNHQAEHLLGPSTCLQAGAKADTLLQLLAERTLDTTPSDLVFTPDQMRGLTQRDLQWVRPKLMILRIQFFAIHGPQQQDMGYGLTLQDITEQKSIEKLKAQLLATVAHELRAPLASIKGFATTLLREDVMWDAAAQREFAEIIDQESDRLTTLVDDLLDTSRFVLGHYPLAQELVDLNILLSKAAKQAQARTSIHKLDLELGEPTMFVWADPQRIQQVLYNLVDNAIKYTPNGGTITLRTWREENQVGVSIHDQGIGIPTDEQNLVFELFYRGKEIESSEQVGLGLGLPICRGIIEAHGGTIWVKSERGHGSTFYFTLPTPDPSVAPQ